MENKNLEPNEQQLLETIDYGVKFYNVVLFVSFVIYITYILITKDFSENFLSIMVFLAIIIDGCILRGTRNLMFETNRVNTRKEVLSMFKQNIEASVNRTRILKIFVLIVLIINIFAGSSFPEIYLLSTMFISCIISMGITKTAQSYVDKLLK